MTFTFHNRPVLCRTALPPPLAPFDDDQEDTTNSQPNKRRADETIPRPQVLQPRGDAIPNSKAHGVSNNNARRQRVARDLAVRVDQVRHGQRDADRIREGRCAHGADEAEPVDVRRGPDAPEDERRRQQYGRHGEQPESVLGLRDALVPPGDAEDEPVGEETREGGPVLRVNRISKSYLEGSWEACAAMTPIRQDIYAKPTRAGAKL